MKKLKAIIMGAAGRDFHNYNVFFKDNPAYKVVAFTAAQIPDIDGRNYEGIPIFKESDIGKIIKEKKADEVFFSYSDISYRDLMEKAAKVMACGAQFSLLSKDQTMLKTKKPVIAVTAVRTGCGKSAVSQAIADFFRKKGVKVGIVRHPMPYGDLKKQICQKFSTIEDLDKHKCTIEEREEYEPYVEKGLTIFAGVDYKKILQAAEKESDVILWDGGNNDFPFYKPDLYITLADAYRPGHEVSYYPGEVNFRSADVIVVSKAQKTLEEGIKIIMGNAKKLNPKAEIIKAISEVTPDKPELVRGKRVLVIEDGPSVTHGELKYGAGYITAEKYGAKEMVDPRPYAVGSIKATYEKYPHMSNILPAMGYSKQQIKDLQDTIDRVPCDSVIIASPCRIENFINFKKPYTRVKYALKEVGKPKLEKILQRFVKA